MSSTFPSPGAVRFPVSYKIKFRDFLYFHLDLLEILMVAFKLPEWNVYVRQPRNDAFCWPLLDGVHVHKRVLCRHHLSTARRQIGFKQKVSAVIFWKAPGVVKVQVRPAQHAH